MVLILGVVLLQLSGAGAASGQDSTTPTPMQTTFSYRGEAGNAVANGRYDSFASPTDSVTVQGDRARISFQSFHRNGGVHDFGGSFEAGLDDTLRPGIYRDVGRFPLGRSPGMDVVGDGRGCGEVYGSFTVDQVDFDDDGRLTTLDLSFVERCGSPTAPALRGVLRYRYLPLSYSQRGPAGGFVGGGSSRTYRNATSTIVLSGTPRNLKLIVSGPRDEWSALLRPPEGEVLEAGRSYLARDEEDSRYARLNIDGNGQACNHSTGAIIVDKLSVSDDGQVTRAAVRFAQRCDGSRSMWVGDLHYFD